MVATQEIKEWVQRRIDYWENNSDHHHKEPIQTLAQLAFEEGEEQGEEKGLLAGFYMVMEFIDGQRR